MQLIFKASNFFLCRFVNCLELQRRQQNFTWIRRNWRILMSLFSQPHTTESCCQIQSFCMTQGKVAQSLQEWRPQLQLHQMMLNLNPAQAEELAEEREKRRMTRSIDKFSCLWQVSIYCSKYWIIGSCVLKGICNKVLLLLIITLNQHLDWYLIDILIDTWLTLDRHLIKNWLIVG